MCTSKVSKPALCHRVAHLDMAVHALLAQDRDLRPAPARCAPPAPRRGVEAQMHVQARVVARARRRVLGVRAGRVVAQPGDAPAHLVPGLVQVAQRRAEHRLGVAPDLDHAALVRSCRSRGCAGSGRARATRRITSSRSRVGTWITAPSSSLNSACRVSSSRRSPTCAAQFFESPYSARLSAMPSPSVTSMSTFRLTPSARRTPSRRPPPTGRRRCGRGRRAGGPRCAAG